MIPKATAIARTLGSLAHFSIQGMMVAKYDFRQEMNTFLLL